MDRMPNLSPEYHISRGVMEANHILLSVKKAYGRGEAQVIYYICSIRERVCIINLVSSDDEIELPEES